jgi:hypothetical protein
VICAVNPAIDALRTYLREGRALKITRLYEEGAFVPDRKRYSRIPDRSRHWSSSEHHPQRVGVACVSAYNAYKMAMNLKKVVHRHARPPLSG